MFKIDSRNNYAKGEYYDLIFDEEIIENGYTYRKLTIMDGRMK